MQDNSAILHLALFKNYFDAILSGEKRIEYRRRCLHWDRILSKPYDLVHFVNGYGKHRPWFECEIVNVECSSKYWKIHLGSIVSSGNLIFEI